MAPSVTRSVLFRPSINYPDIPYHEMLKESVRRHPEKIAIISGDLWITFRELDSLVNSLANAMLDLGITKGDRVALYLMNGPEFVVSPPRGLKSGTSVTTRMPGRSSSMSRFLQSSKKSGMPSPA